MSKHLMKLFAIISMIPMSWLGQDKDTKTDKPVEAVCEEMVAIDDCQESAQKLASLTLVSFDDSKFYNLVQNAQNAYGHCFEGYDKSVLLKLVYNSGRRPTEHSTIPTKDQFFAKLNELAQDGYTIDVFIFSHGTTNAIALRESTIRGSDILNNLYHRNDGLGMGNFPLRMVYQMNCVGSSLNQEFRQAGAEVVIGSRRVNFYPNQFNAFAKEWNKGNVSVRTALNRANTAASRTAMQVVVKLDATANAPCFSPKCRLGKTILSNDRNNCAYRYFDCQWGLDYPEYQSKDGKEIMNHSSKMIISGDSNMRKNTII